MSVRCSYTDMATIGSSVEIIVYFRHMHRCFLKMMLASKYNSFSQN